MDSLWIVLIAAVIVVVFLAVRRGAPSRAPVSYPYERQPTLFTPAERSFLGVLRQALGSDYEVFGKVRLADVIRVRRGLPRSSWQSAFNRVSAKHLDFVVCRTGTLAPLFAIELDDASHARSSRQARDAFVDKALAAAEMPLARFPVKKAYVLQEVRSEIDRFVAS